MRIINWDDVELPFGNPPSTMVPGIAHLRMDVGHRRAWAWYYRGIKGILTLDVLVNALDAHDNAHKRKHRREAVLASIGKFTWDQTITEEEYLTRQMQAAANISKALDELAAVQQSWDLSENGEKTITEHAPDAADTDQ